MKQVARKLASPAAAIVGVHTTPQALKIDRDPLSLCLEAVMGALKDAGMDKSDIDGISARSGCDISLDFADCAMIACIRSFGSSIFEASEQTMPNT